MRISQEASMSDLLFVDFNGVVYQLFASLLCRLQVDTNKYSGHSFHSGAATSAASAAIEDHLVQT